MAEGCTAVEPLLSAHVDGELEPGLDSAVASHVRTCESCRGEVEQLRVVRSLLRSMPVRRLPADLGDPGERIAAVRGTAWAPLADPGPGAGSRLVQAGAGVAIAVGLLTGAAFSLGGQPDPATPVVAVPMDVYVADHFVHTVNRAVAAPIVLELRR